MKKHGNIGISLSDAHKKKISESNKGKTFSEEHKKKLSLAKLDNKNHLGKKHSEETLNKMRGKKRSEKFKNECRLRQLGKKHSEETIKKLRNLKHTKETREKISEAGKRPCSKETKLKISKANTGKLRTNETKKKLSISTRKYFEKHQIKGWSPNIGKNEKLCLDYLESKWNVKIIRQYQVVGYFLDGYIEELNLGVEIDEKFHFSDKQDKKDIIRDKQIKEKLKCEILRIPESLFIDNPFSDLCNGEL